MHKIVQQYPHEAGRRLLRLDEVIHLVRYGRSAIYAMIKRSEFPAQIKLGPRAVAWNSDDVLAWMDARIEAASKMGGV